MIDKAVNGGVHASTGFELQKHCALFIILERFDELKNKNYFVCIEHSDDVVFGFLNSSNLQKIEAYQIKKSSTVWSINKKWNKIIRGILEVGKSLSEDTFPKTIDYCHKISFLSNQTSKLEVKKTKKEEPSINVTSKIDEANSSVNFYSLPEEIRTKIESNLKLNDESLTAELENLYFEYIDLNKKVKEQRNCLRGKCLEVFKNKIPDPEAAIDTVMKVFRKVEQEFNQGNKSKMLDESKRVYSKEIEDAFDIVTTKAMAFDLWRQEKKELGKKLKISVAQRDNFELQFDNSIDLFKDLNQVEHNKILKFVEENRSIFDECYDETECIIKLYNRYRSTNNCKLEELVIKAAVFAAYIKVRECV